MDLESTHGHHRLLTRREKEKRVDYLGVEARRRRREETLVRLGWTPGLDPKRRRGFWFSGGFADAPLVFFFFERSPLVFWRRRRWWWCGGPRPWMVMARSS